MTLDVSSLLVVLAMLTLLTTLLLGVAALTDRGQREITWWALGNVAVCLGFAVGALPAVPLLVHGVMSYGLIGAGLGLAYAGSALFQGGRAGWRPVAVTAVLGMAGPAWFAFVHPDLDGRLMTATFVFGVACLACGVRLLVGHGHAGRIAPRITAGGFFVVGLALVLRSWGRGAGLASWLPIDAFNLLAVIAGQVSITFGFVLMLENRRSLAMRRLSMRDPLTGLLNRSGLEVQAVRVLERARRQGLPVAVFLFDADHFKRLNDEFGHPGGDAALRRIADVASASLRGNDLLGRHGGEEFIAVLSAVDVDTAMRRAQHLCEAIAASAVEWDGRRIAFTVSVGVAHSDAVPHALSRLIAQADAALYEAKGAGRNRVRLAGPGSAPTGGD